MSITGILSRKCPVAKVVARDSYNANMITALAGADPGFCLRGVQQENKGTLGDLGGLPQEIFKKWCDLVHFQSALTPLKGAPTKKLLRKRPL